MRCKWIIDSVLTTPEKRVYFCRGCGNQLEVYSSILANKFGGDILRLFDTVQDCGTDVRGKIVGIKSMLLAARNSIDSSAIQGQFEARKEAMSSYQKAGNKWVKAGRPTRSSELVREILKEHCDNGCPHYVGQTCSLCNCRIRGNPMAFLSMLMMGTERCPDNPPKFVEMEGFENE